ncbi:MULTISPECIES: SPFH domain-containing protein [unclassified Streptomyces]|uniref:SPFH domain-containing protein n=1 Tax=unclassified Streptomyces TaxID=2593676 RepID=UPI0037B1BBDA
MSPHQGPTPAPPTPTSDRLAVAGPRADGPGSGSFAAGGPRADGPGSGRVTADGPAADRPASGRLAADGPRVDGPGSGRVSAGGSVADRSASGSFAADGLRADGPAPSRFAADGPRADGPGSGRVTAGGSAADRSASGSFAADGPRADGPGSGRVTAGGSAADRSASGTFAADGLRADGPAPGGFAADGPRPDGPAPGRVTADSPLPARPVPAADRATPPSPSDRLAASGPAPAAARPAPLDGNLHLKPVRRLRTEPSAEWTPHPSYGAEPGTGKGAAPKAVGGHGPQDAPAKGSVDDPGPDTELDLVLDLAPGDRAASATFSVPVAVPVPASPTTVPTVPTATSSNSGRRHSVIANETTASIPVHLLFRDDREPAERDEAAALPAAVARRPAAGDRAPATRRPPVPRSAQTQTRVRPSTRPAPVADPRLAERPGPALSGYAALLTGVAGIAGGLAVLWWRGALPAAWQTAAGLTPRADLGVGVGAWALLALLATVVLLTLGGLGRGRVGYAWVLTLFGDYRGSVRRTGLVWVSPLLLRRRVDVRLRHWRSEPLPAVDANGTALRVVVLVVWRIKDTVRAVLGIEDHEAYLSAQVEAAMARVLSQLPADAFHEDAPSLRDAEAVGDALTRMLTADCEPVGVEVYSAQPTGIEYAPEVAAAMQRRRIAAIDSKHRDSVLTSVVDAVDDTVNRLTTRGIVELDDYERKALVKDLTVAFYTGRSGGGDGA